MGKVLKRKSGIITADLNGETVMMDIATGQYYNLGEVGGRIWEILEKTMSRDALVDLLIKEYDVSREQCEKDIEPFLEQLLNSGLMSESME